MELDTPQFKETEAISCSLQANPATEEMKYSQRTRPEDEIPISEDIPTNYPISNDPPNPMEEVLPQPQSQSAFPSSEEQVQNLAEELLPLVRTRGQMRMILDQDPKPAKRAIEVLETPARKRRGTTGPPRSPSPVDEDSETTLSDVESSPTPEYPDSEVSEEETGVRPSIGIDHRYDKSALIFKDDLYWTPRSCNKSFPV